jgi:ATP-dependent Clp protease ATP-binding subunit ClpB
VDTEYKYIGAFILQLSIYIILTHHSAVFGRFQGQFEERLQGVIKEVQDQAGKIILFIDEIHTMVGAGKSGGGNMDMSNILKPALSRGELQLLGATTLDEYRILEKDAALARRFQSVYVREPTVEDTLSILRGLKVSKQLFLTSTVMRSFWGELD